MKPERSVFLSIWIALSLAWTAFLGALLVTAVWAALTGPVFGETWDDPYAEPDPGVDWGAWLRVGVVLLGVLLGGASLWLALRKQEQWAKLPR